MKFSSLLPFEKYVLTTTITAEEIQKRLYGCMMPEHEYVWTPFSNRYSRPYRGYVTGLTFRMIRNIGYRNSFLPVITGRINSVDSQTNVVIRMRLSYFVMFFMSVWLGLTGLFSLIFLVSGIIHFRQVLQNGVSTAVIIPFIMFAFGSGLVLFAFKSESNQSKEFLADLLKADRPG